MNSNYLSIRNTVRAMVIRQQSLLLIKKQDEIQGLRYCLPGGAQLPGETIIEALQRECLEEINTTVQVEKCLHLADFFKSRVFDDQRPPRHQLEIIFLASVSNDYVPCMGIAPDKHQLSVEWVDFQALQGYTFSPAYLSGILPPKSQTRETDIYLGAFK